MATERQRAASAYRESKDSMIREDRTGERRRGVDVYHAVIFCCESIKYEVGVFVHADEITQSELLSRNEPDEWEKDCLTGRGLAAQ